MLVELPADCEAALAWVGDEQLVPPVALLGYVVDQPHRAAFLPFAEFSPEWQAFTWARRHGVTLRAIDLPLQQSLAKAGDHDDELALAEPLLTTTIGDPLAALAAAAGDPDPERWWDDVIEHRGDGEPAFDEVAAAMTAVRGGRDATSLSEAQREAHMRQVLRRTIADGHQRIAVVCGAWHVPALAEPLPAASTDAHTLRGLPRVKVGLSWVPWTHRRLASATGYGAGVRSPGWYAHVFNHPGEPGIGRWFVGAARLLRERGMSASPDDLIAATRAATALAALRNRPRPGLAEVLDAAETVMVGTGGMTLIQRELIVGDAIGEVPDNAPQVPLARDLAAQQRKVRLKPEATTRTLELDVRAPNGRARSILLHRLRALGVHWGSVEEGRGSSGTFRETWRLVWEPELTIRVIEQAAHGTTTSPCWRTFPRSSARSWPESKPKLPTIPMSSRSSIPSARSRAHCGTATCAAPMPARCARCSTGWSCACSPVRSPPVDRSTTVLRRPWSNDSPACRPRWRWWIILLDAPNGRPFSPSSPSAATCTGWCKVEPHACCTTVATGTERRWGRDCRGRCRSEPRRRSGQPSSRDSSPAVAPCSCTTPSCST